MALTVKVHVQYMYIESSAFLTLYGAKVRFPHALVMTFLFKEGSLQEKIKAILEATFTHSKNLAVFVFLYKSLTNLMQHFQTEKSQIHSFIAAFIGGYFVFGKYNKVNEQINLYLLSRIIYGLAKLAVKRGYIPKPKGETFPWFAAIVWGIVLWEFEYEQDTLQSSLQSSMTYLYHDSNKWTSLKNFLWHNK
ncbi:peroxisomal membrane protein 4-like isoform X2 [Mercenaria mercenaria]|uniref:peroxisomal membrane protein 4-like isoform X2 n=1 Tax=Mercenaria mercenaria TaxID=6596 RepID=UPI00234F9753|nr:peroxisomal membrane protein 4-like isoform X2 [Mercenaria mercenaria]